MVVLVNRAKMTTSTTGTGTITLGSVVDGYQTFAAAGVSNGDSVRYVIEDGTSNWEIGSGTYTASGTTLSRNPSESSDGGSAITLSGDAIVFISAIASDIQPITYVTTTFTATAAQTTFTVSYTAGLVEVFLNGAKLSGADFTATNGTSIVLASGANVGDTVDVIAYGTVSVANTYTQAQADALFVDVAGDTMTGGLNITSGNLGVGTSSPTNVLHVHQSDATSNSYVHITQADGGSAATDGLSIGIEDGGVNAVIRNRENGYLRMYTNNAERLRIDSSGLVGIGTSSPSATLDVRRGDTDGKIAEFHQSTGYGFELSSSQSVATITAGYNQAFTFETGTTATERLRIDSSGVVVINQPAGTSDSGTVRITGGTSGLSNLQFADTADGNIGMLQYDHTSNYLLFQVNNAERMRIDSSGRLLHGKTTSGDYVTGTEIQPAGAILSYRAGGVAAIHGRTDDGEIIRLTSNSSIVGSIGALSGDVYIQGPTNHSGIQFNTNGVLPLRNSAIVDNTLDIGGSSYRWKDLYLSGKAYDGDGNLRAIPRTGSEKTSSYTLTTSDVGLYVQVGSGGSVTIPNSTFSQGDAVSIFNHTSGDITITCSISTAYIAGTDGDVNSVTLATRGVCTILFISTTLCVLSGNVS